MDGPMRLFSVTSSYTAALTAADKSYTDVVLASSAAAARTFAVDRYSSPTRDSLKVDVVPFLGKLDARVVARLSVDADDNPVFVVV